MTRHKAGDVIRCYECGKPWGVYGAGQGDALRAAFADWWADRWSDLNFGNDAPDDPPPVGDLSEPSEMECVYISDTDAMWLEETGNPPEVGEPDLWYEADELMGVPDWWSRPRRRTFTRWDCCGLPNDPADAAGLYEDSP